jgi:hypothetical protein
MKLTLLACLVGVLGGGLLAGCGGGGRMSTPTTGQDAPIVAHEINRPNGRVHVDPDSMHTANPDVLSVVTVRGNGRYRLEVTNTSAIGFVDSFTWVPPPGATVRAVTRTSTGHCRLASGNISCSIALRPPTCTCRGDGGSVTIDFTADVPKGRNPQSTKYGLEGGRVNVESETPVPYIIPSSANQAPSLDLPLCKKGERSSAAVPCVSRG